MTKTHTLTVSIGRKVADQNLFWWQWRGFQREVRAAISTALGVDADEISHYKGSSVFEGQPEESAVFAVFDRDPNADLTALKLRLSVIARRYGQWSVAVMFTAPTFVDGITEPARRRDLTI